MSPWHKLFPRSGIRNPKLELMSAMALFDGLGSSQLRELMGHVDEARFAPGELLMRQGRQQHSLYILAEGVVDVQDEQGRRSALGPGRWLGERAMLERRPAAATGIARTPGRALVMGHGQLRALKAHPELVERLLGAAPPEPAAPRQPLGQATA